MHDVLLSAMTRLFATEAFRQPWARELAAALRTVPLFTDLRGRGVDLRQRHRLVSPKPPNRSSNGSRGARSGAALPSTRRRVGGPIGVRAGSFVSVGVVISSLNPR